MCHNLLLIIIIWALYILAISLVVDSIVDGGLEVMHDRTLTGCIQNKFMVTHALQGS